MSRYILEGFENDELEQAIKDCTAYPFVRELCFQFKLRVLCKVELNGVIQALQMCLPNGMAVGKVFTRKNAEDKLEYCYRSPYYKKERGRSETDKETLHSVKVSSLISTIKRIGAIPKIEKMHEKKLSKLKEAKEIMELAMGSTYKSTSELQADEIHALLCAFLGETPNGNHLTVDTIKCKKVLDKYNEADRVRVKKLEEVGRFFYNPFYMIGVDEFNHFIVGKVKLVAETQYEIIEPFKRYKDITEREDLIPVMTMTKLAYEGKHKLQGGYVPVADEYSESLDALFFYTGQPTHYDYAWMATPC